LHGNPRPARGPGRGSGPVAPGDQVSDARLPPATGQRPSRQHRLGSWTVSGPYLPHSLMTRIARERLSQIPNWNRLTSERVWCYGSQTRRVLSRTAGRRMPRTVPLTAGKDVPTVRRTATAADWRGGCLDPMPRPHPGGPADLSGCLVHNPRSYPFSHTATSRADPPVPAPARPLGCRRCLFHRRP